MAYLHIDNLYKTRDILLFRECYALEKVHGTSAHIGYSEARGIFFYAGSCEHERFVGLFDEAVQAKIKELAPTGEVTIYGEAYGGKVQGMSATYGPDLRFIAFDVLRGKKWLQVEQAAGCVTSVGLEFVPFERTSTDLASLDAVRDKPSEVSIRRGITEARHREGVVLRPLQEFTKNNDCRIIAKHKGDAFSERKNTPKVDDPEKQQVLVNARAIADEWVTPMRLEHICGRGIECLPENIPKLIEAMVEDVEREAKGEIVVSKDARKAIGHATAMLVKVRMQDGLRATP